MTLKKVNDPHDRFLRRAISDLDNAKALFRAYLPDWVAASLALDDLRFESELSLDDELNKMLINAVYSAPMVGFENPAFLVLLVEHKSNPYDVQPAKMERYRMAQMDEIARKRKMKSKPIVIPFLIYHGKEPYTGPVSVPETAEGPSHLIKYAFARSFYTIDLVVADYDTSFAQSALVLFFLIMRHHNDPVFQEAFEDIFQKLKTLIGKVNLPEMLQTISVYLHTVMSKADYETVAEIAIKYLGPGEGGIMITAREAYYQEGKEEGRQEGRKQGRVEGREEGREERTIELIKSMLLKRMPVDDIAEITNWPRQRLIALQQELS